VHKNSSVGQGRVVLFIAQASKYAHTVPGAGAKACCASLADCYYFIIVMASGLEQAEQNQTVGWVKRGVLNKDTKRNGCHLPVIRRVGPKHLQTALVTFRRSTLISAMRCLR